MPDRPHDGAGVAKLTDFGVARMVGDDALTLTGDVVGTLAYMAPEQAEGREVGEEADLYALALVLYEALSGVNPVRGRGAAATARRVGARLPALGRLRRDLPLELCHALDRAVLARPEQRGTLADLRARARRRPAGGRRRARDDRRQPAARAWPGRRRAPRVRPRARVAAALAAGAPGRRGAGLADAGAGAFDVAPAAGAAAAARGRAARCRGWAGSPWRCALAAWAGGADRARHRPGGAADRRPPAPRPAPCGRCRPARRCSAWPAWRARARRSPAQAARPWQRAALGALGAWWLALAEVLTGDRLALGRSARRRALDAKHLDPLLTSGALAARRRCGRWRRWRCPILVRGRVLAADVVGATAWAAALGSATQAVAGTLSWQPTMRGLVAGAVVAGGLAVAFAASRGEAYGRSAS